MSQCRVWVIIPEPSQQDIINLSKVGPTVLIGSFLFQQLLMSLLQPSVLQLFIILVNKMKIRLIKVSCRHCVVFLGVVVLDIFMSLPLLFWPY